MMNTISKRSTTINLNIGDQLTSVSCGHIIVELIKFIAYQRLQIPYTYQWLKHLINQKKSREDQEKSECFQSYKHYRTASSALENLDFIIKSVLQEISGPILPEEVCITLGATPVTTKEMYRFFLPPLCHKPQCQSSVIATDYKIQQYVFRSLVTSEALDKVFFEPLPPTNMYVFIQKKVLGNQDMLVNIDNFSLATGCRVPKLAKIVNIDFRKQLKENILCCDDFPIFQDVLYDTVSGLPVTECDRLDENDEDVCEIKSTPKMKWFQSIYVVKGFKDCTVNGSSITNMWLES